MFVTGMQTVLENETSVEVCVILSHTNLQRDVIVALATQSGTATGKYCPFSPNFQLSENLCSTGGLDYTSITEQILLFNYTTTNGTECFDVIIKNDDLHEDDLETFEISFVMTDVDPAVDLVQTVQQITIVDDDSMYTNCSCHVMIIIMTTFLPGVGVIFTQNSYTINENNSMFNVCVSLEGNTEIPVVVLLLLEQDEEAPANMSAIRKLFKYMFIITLKLVCSATLIYNMFVFVCMCFIVGLDVTSLVDSQITLEPNTSLQEPMCQSVEVFDDTLYETIETFLVTMNSSMERVLVSTPVQVVIIDDDG